MPYSSGFEPKEESNNRGQWRLKLHEIIFEAETPAGKTFDILLILSILRI